MKYKKILEPIEICGKTIRNRMVVSAMVVCYVEEDGFATERFIAYHEHKAKGGWGLIITEDFEVAPKVGGFRTLPGLYDDAQIEGYKELTDRVHKEGAAILAQIYHAGRETTSDTKGGRVVAPSAVKDPTIPEIPEELTYDEIQEIIQQFISCAERAKKAGFDGVEVHGAHGYLIGSFVSPFSNRRTDEYGGTMEGRYRLPKEIVSGIREKVGDDFIISYRMSSEEYIPGGLTVEDTKILAREVEEAGANIIHVSQGVYATTENVIASSSTPRGNYLVNTEAIKKAVSIPVIAVGRINDPMIAEGALLEGRADMVTMARASLADPDMPRKVMEGRTCDILHCIGCNQGCIGMNVTQEPVRCLANPHTGMEYKYGCDYTPAETRKKVFVAGGGVAGAYAAIVAAGRGHDVTLFEADAKLGGQWIQASTPMGKGEFTSLIRWQSEELKRQGANVKLNTKLTREIVDAEKPDVVINATGSEPRIFPMKGEESANVVLARDILLGKVLPGKNVLMIGGGDVGCETADFMMYHGTENLTLIEVLDEIVPVMLAAPKKALLDRMKEKQVKVYTTTMVDEVKGTTVVLKKKNDEQIILEDVDMIVRATGVRSNTSLINELQGCECEVYSVGDCNGTKSGYKNILEAYDLAYSI